MKMKLSALALAAMLAAPLYAQTGTRQEITAPAKTSPGAMDSDSLDKLYDGAASMPKKQHTVTPVYATGKSRKSNVNEYYGKVNASGNTRGKAPAAAMPKLAPSEDGVSPAAATVASPTIGTAVKKALETVQKTIGAVSMKEVSADSFNTGTLTGTPGAKPITTGQLEPWTIDEDKPAQGSSAQTPAPAANAGPSRMMKIVSAPLNALEKIAKKQVYKERSKDLDATYNVGANFSLGGAGYFTAKILNADEIKADPLRQQVRDSAASGGQDIVFLRTNTKAQLFGGASLPVSVSGMSIAGRLTGTVEILETRAIPRSWTDAYQHAKQRVFLWPLTAKTLQEDMKPGEDITITGRVETGSGASIGAGVTAASFVFGNIGAGASTGAGHARDKWMSFYIKKLDDSHVRVVVQDGNGQVFSSNLRLYAGLDVYDDSVIPSVNASNLESTKFGAAVVKGEVKIISSLEKLAQVEFTAAFTNGEHSTSTEGWSYVSLTDAQTASALDRLMRFDSSAMRALPAQTTSRGSGQAGKVNIEMRDVTQDANIQFRLSKLHLTRASGAVFYEIIWQNDGGEQQHYLVGTVKSTFHGDVTNTNRAEESTLWLNMNTNDYQVTVLLGPQDRLMTTTREVINDVIATQRAMGVAVEAKIDHPALYLQLFGLGNYGRTSEKGYFTVLPAGIRRMASKTRDEALLAYLKADWIYERESFPPGYIFGAGQAPLWASANTTSDISAALNVLEAAASLGPSAMSGDSTMMHAHEYEYRQLAPKRFLRSDLAKYMSAKSFADHFAAMTSGGIAPEKVMECFLAFRRDSFLELKRSVAATAMMARGDNANDPGYAGYLEMTGNSVTLKPVGLPNQSPETPVTHVNNMLATWKQ